MNLNAANTHFPTPTLMKTAPFSKLLSQGQACDNLSLLLGWLQEAEWF